MANPSICGDDSIYIPITECDECEAFAQRLDTVEDHVTTIQEHLLNIYTKEEVDALIGDIEHVRMEVVTELPATGESNVIYLLQDATDPDMYEMYVYTQQDGWVPIGSTNIDLTNYVSKDDLNNLLAPVEGDTASGPYAVGDVIVRDKKMYRVTDAIATDDPFTSANTESTTAILELQHLNNVVHRTLTIEGWQQNGDEYVQTVSLNNIYSMQPDIAPCGVAIGTRATPEQVSAFGAMDAIADTDAKKISFYSPGVPATVVYVNIQGVD